MAKTTKSANDLFLMSLRDIYDAEKQILRALPKMMSAAESSDLEEAFEDHISETEQQVQRLETIFAELGEEARPKRCEAIRALIREGDRHIREFAGTEAGDSALASAGQAVEHYEISQYTSLKRLAQQLGMTAAAEKLDETLQEEMATKDLLDELGAMEGQGAGMTESAEATTSRNQTPRELRASGVQPRVKEMARESNVRERDDQGRFMSDDDDDRRMSRSRSQYDDDRRSSSRSRSRDDDDDRRGSSRSGSRDDDGRSQGRGGWFGDSEGHSEASRRGWENRDDDRSSSRGRSSDDDDRRGSSRSSSRDDDDRRSSRSRSDNGDNRGRGQGGWFGDSEGHSEASRRGWENRDDDRRSSSRDDDRRSSGGRSRDDDDRRSFSRSRSDDDRRSSSRSRDDDDDRRGRRTGGWFGDSEGHSEAAQKAWDRGREPGGWFGDSEGHSEASRRAWERGREPGGWFGDSEGHSEASRRAWERGREPGGWFGDSEGHSEASRRGWENRDDDRRSSRRSYRD